MTFSHRDRPVQKPGVFQGPYARQVVENNGGRTSLGRATGVGTRSNERQESQGAGRGAGREAVEFGGKERQRRRSEPLREGNYRPKPLTPGWGGGLG